MTKFTVYTQLDDFHAPLRAISRLAKEHGFLIPHVEAIVGDADFHYRGTRWVEAEGYSGPDTLDKSEQPISALLNLLEDKINRHRLGCKLAMLDDNLAEIPIGPGGVQVGTRGGFAEVTALESFGAGSGRSAKSA
jgi:hypothetical protein